MHSSAIVRAAQPVQPMYSQAYGWKRMVSDWGMRRNGVGAGYAEGSGRFWNECSRTSKSLHGHSRGRGWVRLPYTSAQDSWGSPVSARAEGCMRAPAKYNIAYNIPAGRPCMQADFPGSKTACIALTAM